MCLHRVTDKVHGRELYKSSVSGTTLYGLEEDSIGTTGESVRSTTTGPGTEGPVGGFGGRHTDTE